MKPRADRGWPARVLVAGLAVLAASCNNVETPTTPTATGPYTDTFASQLGIRGTATRSFTVTEAGPVSVTLTRVGPPETVEVALGVGIPNSGGAGCNLARSIVTGASTSPQITIDAASGEYCVRVFDIGNLTGEVSFSVSVWHP